MSTSPKRLVVLISGGGSNLQAIIDACQSGQVNGEVVAVISNRDNVRGLARAAHAGITSAVLSHKMFADRDSFDEQLRTLIDSFQPDLVVLAGFMRILTPAFVAHYHGRMLNIHPSRLPKFRGLNTHARAIEAGESEHGASVHFVSSELDGGPVVLQSSLPIRTDHSPESLAAELLIQEHRLYPLAIEWFCADRLQWRNGLATLDGESLQAPIQLSEI